MTGGRGMVSPPRTAVTTSVIDATLPGMRTRRLVWITGIALALCAVITVLGAVGALVPDVLDDPAARAVFGLVAIVGLAGVVGTLVEIVRLREAADER